MGDTFELGYPLESRLIAGVLAGLILGSFTSMLSYRLPRGLSTIWPRSHCPACKAQLQPCDLIPLLSFAAQRGNCRFCGAFIGWRYPVIEASLALAAGAAFALFGLTLWLLIALALMIAAATAITVWLERAGTR
jgi:leader peptidase (prepilin peptidase) / N-methyltransferase